MLTLYHHPFCPFSRFIRLTLGEYGVTPKLVEERLWERRNDFLVINPAATLPVLLETDGAAVIGVTPVSEYIDETLGRTHTDRHLMPQGAIQRAEVRRLIDWFNDRFHREVTQLLVHEKIEKRYMPVSLGGGPPDTACIRAGKANIRYHIAYMSWLLRGRDWLAGDRMTLADLVACAHLSCIDYCGDVPWDEDETVKAWYVRLKSRPSFRPLLSEKVAGIQPAPCYTDLDF